MRIQRFEDHDPVEPAGHTGFASRRLVNSKNGGDGTVSVTHASIRPYGAAVAHVHDHSVQIYVCLEGRLTVGDGEGERELERLSTVVFEAGSPHFVENRTSEPAAALVITAPELRRD